MTRRRRAGSSSSWCRHSKDSAGDHACTACPANREMVGTGSSSLADCLYSPGWYSDGAACVQCVAGSYKAFPGNYSCSVCPAEASPVGSTALAS